MIRNRDFYNKGENEHVKKKFFNNDRINDAYTMRRN